ncbi:MAG TPA: phosphatase PAP2 family protein [Pseudomonadales bacterium]|nr:phosphatase PAP2 family protein [Pseudomonadales bacterium]
MKMLAGLHNTDIRMFFWVQQYQCLLLRSARFVSRTADGALYVVIPLFCLLLFPLVCAGFSSNVVLAFAIERPLYYLLKNSCKRRRPPAAIPGFTSMVTASDEFSFPSGHTCGAFLFTTLLCTSFGFWLVPLYIWAACVGLSRVVLGVHFPTDTLVGAVLGIAIGVFVAGHGLL